MSRSTSVTAQEFYDSYIKSGLTSVGVYGLTPREFAEGRFPIECFSSPSKRNPNHSHADFSGLTSGQRIRKAKELCESAKSRGRLHP